MIKTNTTHHIDVITKYFYPVTAGIETNIMETYSILVKKGWDVTIHTCSSDYLTKNSLKPRETIRGLRVVRYPFRSQFFGYWPRINWDTTSIVSLHNFNVYFWPILCYSLWRRLLGRKHYVLFLTPHGGFNPEWTLYSIKEKLIKIPYHYLLGNRLINLVVDKVRAVSEWERLALISKGVRPDKIITIINGAEKEAYVDIDALSSTTIKQFVKDTGKYLIQIGRIYPIKNYETTISALPHVNKSLKFVIVGPEEQGSSFSWYKQSLIDLAQKLHVEDRVIFYGTVHGVDKYYLIKHARMMVHMALWESFCNVVYEGMGQGLVCLVANNTALPLLIKNGCNGFCLPTNNSVALAKQINYVDDNYDSPSIQTIRAVNRDYGLGHSWATVASEIHHVYTSLRQRIHNS